MIFWGHIFLNIVIIIYIILIFKNNFKIKEMNTGFTKVISIVSLFAGCILYVAYIFITSYMYKTDGLDYGSFVILLNSWAFLNATERIINTYGKS